MYAVIQTGGKQYKVEKDSVLYIEKLDVAADDTVTFDRVLACGEVGEAKLGNPYVKGASVTGKVLKNGKSPKILVYKYKAKKNYRRRQGHRQPYTKVQIEKVNA